MVASLLSDSWSFYKKHILAILALVLPVIVPVEILTLVLEHSSDGQEYEWLIWTISVLAYPLYGVAIVYYIASIISGDYLPHKSLWLLGIKYWLPFLLLNIISVIAIIIGFILLIVPGIIISIRLAFSQFELLLNRQGPLEAMRLSWINTKDHMAVIFAGFCVITAVIYLPFFALSYLLHMNSFWGLEGLLNIICTVADIFYVVFAFRVYEFSKPKDITND